MKKRIVNISNLEGLKKAEKLQEDNWIPLYNGFFSESMTMIKGTEKEIEEYKNNRFK